jgi:hypothetical protein
MGEAKGERKGEIRVNVSTTRKYHHPRSTRWRWNSFFTTFIFISLSLLLMTEGPGRATMEFFTTRLEDAPLGMGRVGKDVYSTGDVPG